VLYLCHLLITFYDEANGILQKEFKTLFPSFPMYDVVADIYITIDSRRTESPGLVWDKPEGSGFRLNGGTTFKYYIYKH